MSMKDNLPDDPDILKEEVMRLQEELERRDEELLDSEKLVLELKEELDSYKDEILEKETGLREVNRLLKKHQEQKKRRERFEESLENDRSDYGGLDISPLENLNEDDEDG
jgi:chromosome segregation ATPase